MGDQKRVCDIGAGPSGMSALFHFGKMVHADRPEIVCYEKQTTWSGLWNYTWRTGWWKSCKSDLKQFIRFSTVVKQVSYNDDTNDFTVRVRDLQKDNEITERFTHVIVAVGIFSVPNVPDFPGLDEFPGRVLHAHNFREPREYKDCNQHNPTFESVLPEDIHLCNQG